jgi:hypothetical protein
MRPGDHRQWKTGLGNPPAPRVETDESQFSIFVFWAACMVAGALLAIVVRGVMP